MQHKLSTRTLILISIVCGLLLATTFIAGCTSTSPAPATPVATADPQSTPADLETAAPTLVVTTVVPAITKEAVTTTSTPAPVYTYSEGNVVAYTAASHCPVYPPGLPKALRRCIPATRLSSTSPAPRLPTCTPAPPTRVRMLSIRSSISR